MEPFVVQAQSINLLRGGRPVLRDVSVTVRPGETVGLIGRNGAGKTSLLETLLGFHPSASQAVKLWGQPVLNLGLAHKRRIAMVPQRDELIDGLTVSQQVALIASFYPDWDAPLAASLLHMWELPPPRAVRELSLGQRQRLSIILAICQRPGLLVLDEPVASLDPLARAEFLQELKTLVATGDRSLIFSSHIVNDLEPLVSHVWILHAGALRWHGRVEDIASAAGEGADPNLSLQDVFLRIVKS